ncbi:MAG: hypothetical protein ABFC96_05695 [Thermoguttaceae bacterium]
MIARSKPLPIGPQKTSGTPAPKKKLTWRWRLAIIATVLVIVVWLLPPIVARTPLIGWAINKFGGLNGTAEIQSVSLDWFSPVAATGIKVKDKHGKTVASVASLSGERSLASIALNYTNLGRFHVRSPKLAVVVHDDGRSNLEELLANYLEPKKPEPEKKKSSTSFAVSLDVKDGSVTVVDETMGRTWEVSKLAASFDMPKDVAMPIVAQASIALDAANPPATLAAGLKWAPTGGEATVKIDQFPLAILRPVANRLVSRGTTLAGRLSTDVRASWGGKEGKNGLLGQLNVADFSFACPALFSADTVQLGRLQTSLQAAWQSDRLDIEKASLDCDVATATLVGVIPLGGSDGISLTAIIRQRQELGGQLDLAGLARMFPATLGLKKDTRIDSGTVQWTLSSRPTQQGAVWHGQLDTTALSATSGGRQIAWQQPINAVLDAHETPQGPVVDNLQCQSDFLHVGGAGTPDDFAATVRVNFNQLAERLRQFLNLEGVQLTGQGEGRLNWKRVQQQFDAGGTFQMNGFQWSTVGKPAWREDSVTATFGAKGQSDPKDKTRIDTASVSVVSGADQLAARLISPVTDLGNSPWAVHAELTGQLQSWPGRLAMWLPANSVRRLEGAYRVVADGIVAGAGVTLKQLEASAIPLVVDSSWMTINEPQVVVGMAGSWDRQKGRIRLDPALLSTATLGVQAKDVEVSIGSAAPADLNGTITCQGDLGRLRQWFSDPKVPSPWRLAGQLNGTVQLLPSAGMTAANVNVRLAKLAVSDGAGQQFFEPEVSLIAVGRYDPSAKTFQLEKAQLGSSTVTAALTGRVTPVSGHSEGNFQGQVNYDLERLCGLLRPQLGSTVRLTGRGTSDVRYRGPIALSDALSTGQGEASARWDQADIGGLKLGGGQIKATMGNGLVQATPLDLSVSQGRVHLAPAMRLQPAAELTLPAGPLAERIQIDPAMCASMLQYAAPVVADASAVRGSFSVFLDRCRIPLADPKKCDVAGQLVVHTVEIGSSKLLKEFATLLGRDVPAKLKQESVVKFVVQNGRVYHENMELQFPDLTIRTSGWVGFDRSLEITAEMPVPPKWLVGNNSVTQAMRNQMIRLPVRNTLDKPQLDRQEMERISQQFIKKAAGNLIDQGIKGGLDQLFKPRK